MIRRDRNIKYFPGMYHRNRSVGRQMVEAYFRKLDEEIVKTMRAEKQTRLSPTICISRKIGSGALEIADLLAQRLDYTVVDRQIIEHIAENKVLSRQTVQVFDERYPGKIKEFSQLLFGEKSFVRSDYSRCLTECVLALAHLQPSIFVGRGTHLILPREKVFSVRITGSVETRARRLEALIEKDIASCRIELEHQDADQAAFFKKVFGKKNAPSTEFDMIINRDYLDDPESICDILELAFQKRMEAMASHEKTAQP